MHSQHNVVLNKEYIGQVLPCSVQFQRGAESILGDGTTPRRTPTTKSCGASMQWPLIQYSGRFPNGALPWSFRSHNRSRRSQFTSKSSTQHVFTLSANPVPCASCFSRPEDTKMTAASPRALQLPDPFSQGLLLHKKILSLSCPSPPSTRLSPFPQSVASDPPTARSRLLHVHEFVNLSVNRTNERRKKNHICQ